MKQAGYFRSVLIDDAPDDVDPGISEHSHGPPQLGLRRAVTPRNHHGIAGISGEDLCVGRFAGRWSIEDHQAELSGEVIEDHVEHRAREQLLWIRRNDARRQYE